MVTWVSLANSPSCKPWRITKATWQVTEGGLQPTVCEQVRPLAQPSSRKGILTRGVWVSWKQILPHLSLQVRPHLWSSSWLEAGEQPQSRKAERTGIFAVCVLHITASSDRTGRVLRTMPFGSLTEWGTPPPITRVVILRKNRLWRALAEDLWSLLDKVPS